MGELIIAIIVLVLSIVLGTLAYLDAAGHIGSDKKDKKNK